MACKMPIATIYWAHDERYRAIEKRFAEVGVDFEYCDDAELIAKKGYKRLPHFEMDGKDYGLSAMLSWIAKERIKSGEIPESRHKR